MLIKFTFSQYLPVAELLALALQLNSFAIATCLMVGKYCDGITEMKLTKFNIKVSYCLHYSFSFPSQPYWILRSQIGITTFKKNCIHFKMEAYCQQIKSNKLILPNDFPTGVFEPEKYTKLQIYSTQLRKFDAEVTPCRILPHISLAASQVCFMYCFTSCSNTSVMETQHTDTK